MKGVLHPTNSLICWRWWRQSVEPWRGTEAAGVPPSWRRSPLRQRASPWHRQRARRDTWTSQQGRRSPFCTEEKSQDRNEVGGSASVINGEIYYNCWVVNWEPSWDTREFNTLYSHCQWVLTGPRGSQCGRPSWRQSHRGRGQSGWGCPWWCGPPPGSRGLLWPGDTVSRHSDSPFLFVIIYAVAKIAKGVMVKLQVYSNYCKKTSR